MLHFSLKNSIIDIIYNFLLRISDLEQLLTLIRTSYNPESVKSISKAQHIVKILIEGLHLYLSRFGRGGAAARGFFHAALSKIFLRRRS